MPEPLDVLAVMAHPDDAELLCGGALIKSADHGERTGVLDLTAGELGTRGSKALRAQEAARAAEILGLGIRTNAGLPDAGIMNDGEARRVVVEHIRELRPRIVVTHAITGRHPDHRLASQLVHDACYLAGLTNYPAGGDAHRPLKVLYATAFREDSDPPGFVVDITEQMERKMEAIRAYGSQFEGVTTLGEVFPGGDRSVYDQIRAQCARYGSLVRAAYGEPFRAVETMTAVTLGSLTVSSF